MRKKIALVMVALASVTGIALAKVAADDCTAACIKSQKDCMFTCAQIGDDADNKACAESCASKYKACAKACKKK